MPKITMREFARLCTDDPNMHEQVLRVPGTISPEKVLALAEKNGFQITPEQRSSEIEPLSADALDSVTGGTGAQTHRPDVEDWLLWLHIWTGFGDIPA